MMNSLLRKCFAAILLAALAGSAVATDIWFQDNNLGRPGGIPADFFDKFRNPDSFKAATRHIRVYMMRANTLDKIDDQFLVNQFAPYLRENQIKLAINAGGATWSQAGARSLVFDREIAMYRRLKKLGIDIHYISLQSVLSKPLRSGGERVEYSLDRRIDDAIAYSRAARSVFPQVSIGLIDALPTHGSEYRDAYRRLHGALAREKIELSYIHIDMPFDLIREQRRGASWRTLREVEMFVEDELRVRFGLIATSSKGGRASSQAFNDGVLSVLECYAGAKGTPGDYIITSWFPYPERTTPDYATGNDYPAMRTVLEFARQLERLQAAGGAPPDSRADLRAMCGVGYPR